MTVGLYENLGVEGRRERHQRLERRRPVRRSLSMRVLQSLRPGLSPVTASR
jgi:hypothetical protein